MSNVFKRRKIFSADVVINLCNDVLASLCKGAKLLTEKHPHVQLLGTAAMNHS